MTEQTVTPQDQIPEPIQMTEAPASLNFYGVTKNGWNCQFTLRDLDEHRLMNRFANFVGELTKWGVTPKPVGQQPAAPKTAAPAEPTNGHQEQHSDGVGVETFAAESLSVSMVDDKTYYKVIGSIFRKGVTIWPEALTASGFDLAHLPKSLEGYTAYTVKKTPDDKWPQKVTKLAKA
jgi:hypothetical protein